MCIIGIVSLEAWPDLTKILDLVMGKIPSPDSECGLSLHSEPGAPSDQTLAGPDIKEGCRNVETVLLKKSLGSKERAKALLKKFLGSEERAAVID